MFGKIEIGEPKHNIPVPVSFFRGRSVSCLIWEDYSRSISNSGVIDYEPGTSVPSCHLNESIRFFPVTVEVELNGTDGFIISIR